MWCILVDNYSAVSMLDLCRNPESKSFKDNYYVQSLLYALVLWDAIYRAPRESMSTRRFNKIDLEQENELVKRVGNVIFNYPYMDAIKMNAKEFYKEWYEDESYEIEEAKKDAIYYLTLGQAANMNTLLSEKRAKYVEESGISRKIWSREDFLKYLDKEVFEIYKEVYSFFGKEIIKMQTPLLIDYICANATCLRDAIDIAFQLREHKDIRLFRDIMNLFEDAINTGDLLLIDEYQKAISELVNQFTTKVVPTSRLDIKFTITPSLPRPTFAAMFGLSFKHNEERKMNMNFLIELARYGLQTAYRKSEIDIEEGIMRLSE